MIKNYKNKLVIIFYFFLNVILISNYSWAYVDGYKKVLSFQDIKIYKEIFKLQKQPIKNKYSKEWQKVNVLIKKLDNKILLGNVYSQRYLHPTGWRSSYKDLKIWLDRYNDHPDATRISRLAIKRKPKNAKNPKVPTKGFLNGYGTYKSNSLKPRFPLNNNKYSRFSYSISIKFRRAINKRNTKYAENLVNSKKTKKYLNKRELSQLRAELSHAFFIFNQDYEAIRQARLSLSLSKKPNPLALWAGGLASWRKKNTNLSKYFFNKLIEDSDGPEGIVAGGGYWSARIAFVLGEPKKANYYLTKAALKERTFYGSLSMASLGYKYHPNFDLPKLSLNLIKKIISHKGGLRAMALIEVNEFHKSAREFRKIIPKFPISDYPQLLSFASKNNMPGLTFRLAAILRNDHDNILLGGLYPIPSWKMKTSNLKDRALVYAIARQESGFNPRARSSSKAMGVMQIIPSTAAFIMKNREYRLRRSKNHMLYDPPHNIHIGSKYMKFLLNLPLVNQDLMWMLASYNAGPGNFKKWTKNKDYKSSDSLLMLESLPARETRNYIKLVLTNLWIYKIRFKQENNILSTLASGKPIDFKVFFKNKMGS
ncbi:lytic transglycosylase domain-containing protein [Alphaproteobacteria bacterium]|nr:lytic transglycosylase domain-containing protein [Alphaproteobacteria bacterium]